MFCSFFTCCPIPAERIAGDEWMLPGRATFGEVTAETEFYIFQKFFSNN